MKIRNIFYIVATILFATTLASCDNIIHPTHQKPKHETHKKPQKKLQKESQKELKKKPQEKPGQKIEETLPIKTTTNPEIKEKLDKVSGAGEAVVIKKALKLKVAVMLPLTGKNSQIGQSMLNSINMSLFDNDLEGKIELLIFDNKSNDNASKKAIQEIADQNIKLVIGPVFTNSIESISQIAAQNNIAVLSFSNNSELMNEKGIFLSGFSLEQEIDRISSYLIANNNLNFSVIAPNNQYGIRMVEILRKMVEMKDGNFVSSQFYIEQQEEFDQVAKKILNSYIISKEIKDYKQELAAIEDISERKERELEIVSDHKIYANTILIAESGNKVSKILRAIKENNKDGRNIKIIGTSNWDKDSISQNPNIDKALFAGPSNQYYDNFKQRYQQTYNQTPTKIDSIAYDVTSFVIELAGNINSERSIDHYIVNFNDRKGYKGINGLFRFLPNGLVERNLAVLQIKDKTIEVIDEDSSLFLKY